MIHADLPRSRAIALSRKRFRATHRYGPAYRAAKRALRPLVAAGLAICVRCHQPIEPGEWDLGHDDRTGAIAGPEHIKCNRGAPNRNVTSRVW
jgi:hypothetical protein